MSIKKTTHIFTTRTVNMISSGFHWCGSLGKLLTWLTFGVNFQPESLDKKKKIQ